ncbi:uncharacterized protein LOC115210223 [Argonauta hians]
MKLTAILFVVTLLQILDSISGRTFPRTQCVGKEVDIMFVLDSSSSIWPNDYERLLTFLQKFVDTFEIGKSKMRMGVITYSKKAYLEFSIGQYIDRQQLHQAIANITYRSGWTNTGAALNLARKQFQPLLDSSASLVTVVITDGNSRSYNKTKAAAEKLRNLGVRIYAIGIGRKYLIHELKSIASDPENGVYRIFSYKALDAIGKNFFIKSCLEETEARAPQNITLHSTTDPPQKTTYIPVSSINTTALTDQSAMTTAIPESSSHMPDTTGITSNMTTNKETESGHSGTPAKLISTDAVPIRHTSLPTHSLNNMTGTSTPPPTHTPSEHASILTTSHDSTIDTTTATTKTATTQSLKTKANPTTTTSAQTPTPTKAPPTTTTAPPPTTTTQMPTQKPTPPMPTSTTPPSTTTMPKSLTSAIPSPNTTHVNTTALPTSTPTKPLETTASPTITPAPTQTAMKSTVTKTTTPPPATTTTTSATTSKEYFRRSDSISKDKPAKGRPELLTKDEATVILFGYNMMSMRNQYSLKISAFLRILLPYMNYQYFGITSYAYCPSGVSVPLTPLLNTSKVPFEETSLPTLVDVVRKIRNLVYTHVIHQAHYGTPTAVLFIDSAFTNISDNLLEETRKLKDVGTRLFVVNIGSGRFPKNRESYFLSSQPYDYYTYNIKDYKELINLAKNSPNKFTYMCNHNFTQENNKKMAMRPKVS